MNSLQREKTENGLLTARLLKHFISCRGRWHHGMRREGAAAAHAGDLTGEAGTSTWLIDIVAVWRNRAFRRGGWVNDGAVTKELSNEV